MEESRSSVRRLVALIRALPQDSALTRHWSGKQEPEPDHGGKQVITSGAEFAGWMNKTAKD